MNKITKLDHHTPGTGGNNLFGFNSPPTFEEMQAHIAEMNRENWKMITINRTGDQDILFFWEKDVMLAEVSNG